MPMQITLPEAMALAQERWPGLTLRPQSGGTELHGPCPITLGCAERDGFFISLLPQFCGLYQCRKCNSKGWLDDDHPYHRDPAAIADWERRRKEKELEDSRVLKAWQDGFAAGEKAASLQAYHDLLKQFESIRTWLNNEGVSNESIERYNIGFTPRKKIKEGPEFPAVIFPIYSPFTHQIENINWRLLNAPPEYGKYRFVNGIPHASFWANDVLEGEAIATEGTKKGIVVNQEFEKETGKSDLGIVSLPSNNPPVRLIRELFECYEKGVTFAFDPGSEAAIARLSRVIREDIKPKGKAKYVVRPVKIDDAIVKYGITAQDIRLSLKYQAREL